MIGNVLYTHVQLLNQCKAILLTVEKLYAWSIPVTKERMEFEDKWKPIWHLLFLQ